MNKPKIIERARGNTKAFYMDVGQQLNQDDCCPSMGVDVASIDRVEFRVYEDSDRLTLIETLTGEIKPRDVHDYFTPLDADWIGTRYCTLAVVYLDGSVHPFTTDYRWVQS